MIGEAEERKGTTKTVRADDLRIGMFVMLPASWFKHPFLRNQFLITSEKEIEKIRGSGFTELQIDFSRSRIGNPDLRVDDESFILPEQTLLNPPKKWRPEEIVPRELVNALRRSDMPPEEKAGVVKETSLVLMNRLLEDPTAENIQEAKLGIYEMVDCIMSDDNTSRCLLTITNHDFYTYTHSVNVGILALIVAKRLFNGSSRHNMRELGAGFFLHDLGKVNIDPNIINKPGRLNQEEMQIIRQHPADGAKILSETKQLSREAYIIVMQHHERYDGSGYPKGLKEKDIHVYARICSIADVYDALTSERSYKEKLSQIAALKLMRDEMINHFQRELFEKFVLLFTK